MNAVTIVDEDLRADVVRTALAAYHPLNGVNEAA